MQKQSEDDSADKTGSIPTVEEVEKKLADRGIAPELIEDVIWLTEHAHARGLRNFAALAKETSFAASTVSKVLRGKYEADLTAFCSQVRHFKTVWTERQAYGAKVFVPQLSVVQRVSVFCKMIRKNGEIGTIWGRNQSGKSDALKYVAHTELMAAYAKLPAGGATKPSMKAIAKARGGIPLRKSHEEMRDLLLARFNSLWLLLVDEFHQAVTGRTIKTVTVDRIREFNDDCGTPTVLCGTPVVPNMMKDDRYVDFLGQISNRGVFELQIPGEPTEKDILLLIKAYGFKTEPRGEAARIVREIANDKGIGKLSKYLKAARVVAKNKHTTPDWNHFLDTSDSADNYALGKFADEPKQLENGSGGE
jgi:DNA transposition AAA+ family ATPase